MAERSGREELEKAIDELAVTLQDLGEQGEELYYEFRRWLVDNSGPLIVLGLSAAAAGVLAQLFFGGGERQGPRKRPRGGVGLLTRILH